MLRATRSHRSSRLPLLATLVTLSPLASQAGGFPEHIGEIRLRPVLWQALPEQVRAAFVGPGDRAWYQLCHPARREDLPTVRRIIRREFPRKAPQLFGCRPALFEPGGRVWFLTHSGRSLLGYDGTEMIEVHAEEGHFFVGNCPNHGRVSRAGCNLFVHGRAFFVESHGVVCVAGERRSTVQFTEGRPSAPYPVLLREPDGRGVTAWHPGAGGAAVWRWRGGKWTKLDLPGGIDRAKVEAAAPVADGLWLFLRNGTAFFHHYEPVLPAAFRRLLEQLGAEAYRDRKRATEQMAALGTPVLEYARDALKTTDDPEVRLRLREVIESVTAEGDAVAQFGPYRLKKPSLGLFDGAGRLYVTAEEIGTGGKSLGQGVLVADGKGGFQVVASPAVPTRWRSNHSEDSGPLVLRPGSLVWLPRCGADPRPRLLDIERKQVTDVLPDPSVHWLHAVKWDGTVFAGRREPTQPWGQPVMVYQPGARDDRNLLRATGIEIKDSDLFHVASDGTVWTQAPGRGPVRFDGKAWAGVAGLDDLRSVRGFVAGDDGAMILVASDGCALVMGERVTRRATLRELVAACSDDVARRFKRTHGSEWMSVAADRAGNIWVRETRKLSVLVEGRWLEAAGLLRDAGSRTGEIEHLSLCGDGSRVYMTDFMMVHSRGRSFFGEVVGGRLIFSKAPHTNERAVMHLGVRDRAGALWVPGSVRGSRGTCDWISGQLALRITEKGVVQKLKSAGWARLVDQSGNVWLGSVRGKAATTFNIWRDGRIAHALTVPGAHERSVLFSDRPGSVFVWTKLGLQHLLAKDPRDPRSFALGKLYSIEGIDGHSIRAAYSPLGYFLLGAYSDQGGRRYSLHMVPLPKGD